jgi:hypothetical protein
MGFSAVNEFSTQSVDLSNIIYIIKIVSGGSNASHPISTAVAQLQAAGVAAAVAAAPNYIAAAVHTCCA